MITDFCPGGELFFHLHNLGRFSEEQAKFYFCEILLAIEYLHHEKIIFRDLKPENTLIDLDGHIKLIDFGLAKEDHGDRLHTFCGSHEYLSPEMIKRAGYNKSVDFYSLGSFLYEMLTGLPPFWDKDRNVLYNKILHEEPSIPRYLSREVQSLLKGLLRKDPTLRIGSIFGIKEIKDHAWLDDIDWKAIFMKKVPPPFRPNSTKSNFEHEFMNSPIEDSIFYKSDRFSVENDQIFPTFFYSNNEKSKNHNLANAFEFDLPEINKSKSFIETKVLKNTLKCYYIPKSIKKEAQSPSISLSPVKVKERKMGPELLSIKVPPKIVKSIEHSVGNQKTPTSRKSIIKLYNRSFISTRNSLKASKLVID